MGVVPAKMPFFLGGTIYGLLKLFESVGRWYDEWWRNEEVIVGAIFKSGGLIFKASLGDI